jgi:hypothetical protein
MFIRVRAPRLVVAFVSFLSLLFVGCSDLGQPLLLQAVPAWSASELDFGSLLVGRSEERTVTLSNTGNAALHAVVAVSGPHFTLVSGAGAFTLAPQGQHAIVVRFDAADAVPFHGVLSLGPGLPQVALLGRGSLQAVGAQAALSVSSLDFGGVPLGGLGFRSFVVRSVGSADLDLDAVAVDADFSVVVGGGPRRVAPGDSVSVTVRFSPSAGGHRETSIAIGAGLPSVYVRADGTTISFSGNLSPIVRNRACANCHMDWASTDLVNVPSNYGPALITPYDTAQSVLFDKISNHRVFGNSMPPNTAGIPADERALWRTWILEGAHDN